MPLSDILGSLLVAVLDTVLLGLERSVGDGVADRLDSTFQAVKAFDIGEQVNEALVNALRRH